ncbi:MAG: DUF4105 domain-containing protein [Prevotella sp.]|nr:DUF4105 domain-containing protein [Prevotella sp.]
MFYKTLFTRCTAILTLLLSLTCHAEEKYEVSPDSSNFVIASLVTTTPADVIYSSMGHCAIRMQCPSESLDYCFSLEMAAEPGDYAQFFSGQAKAAVVAVPTQEFINAYRTEGRGMTQYELNLTHHEKQQLWRLLDEEVVKPPHLTFNFLNTNCVMMSMLMIEHCLINERIDFGKLPPALQLNNGDLIRYHSAHTPWAQFLYITLSGAACDGHEMMEYRLSPKMIVEVLDKATIQGDSTAARPVFKEKPTPLLAATTHPKPSPITPTMLFGAILLFTVAITIAERFGHCQKTAKILDILLFAFQTIVGIALLYTSTVANLFGSHWNWYIIPTCPIAIILWLTCRKHSWHRHLYLAYTVILILFILATPLSSQLDLPHQLITATFAIRTLANYFLPHHSIQ